MNPRSRVLEEEVAKARVPCDFCGMVRGRAGLALGASSGNVICKVLMRATRFPLLLLVSLLTVRAAAEAQTITNRGDAVKALCQRLIGPGAVVSDVGCGDGVDSMVFASVVGDHGSVLAEEINADRLKKVIETSTQQGFHQVVPILGQSDDPRLPDGMAHLVYMNRVFHHFAQPQAMLTRLWQDLKPGGFLVVIDQQRGPLTEWVPAASREKEHHWTGETTVVRLAREAGFLFHDVLDSSWHEPTPFVLAFRKPVKPPKTAGDPDLPRPLDAARLVHSLPALPAEQAVIFSASTGDESHCRSCGRGGRPPSAATISSWMNGPFRARNCPHMPHARALRFCGWKRATSPCPARLKPAWCCLWTAITGCGTQCPCCSNLESGCRGRRGSRLRTGKARTRNPDGWPTTGVASPPSSSWKRCAKPVSTSKRNCPLRPGTGSSSCSARIETNQVRVVHRLFTVAHRA